MNDSRIMEVVIAMFLSTLSVGVAAILLVELLMLLDLIKNTLKEKYRVHKLMKKLKQEEEDDGRG